MMHKMFSFLAWDWRLLVDIVYYFKIWNKNVHNIIISRVISSHMVPYILRHSINNLGRVLTNMVLMYTCKAPVTMLKKSVSPSDKQTIAFVFL